MSDPILALDADRVSRITGIPQSTLQSWEARGVFTPSFVSDRPRTPFRRIYSFRDVVSLKALGRIRRELRVPLHEITRAGEYLSQHYESPWSELRFGVVGRRLVFRDPETQMWIGGTDGQGVLELNMQGIPEEIKSDLPSVLERDENLHGKVHKNRYVQHNKPLIAGTRIPTSTIWAFHERGYSVQQILYEYPHLTMEDVRAAIEYERSQQKAA